MPRHSESASHKASSPMNGDGMSEVLPQPLDGAPISPPLLSINGQNLEPAVVDWPDAGREQVANYVPVVQELANQVTMSHGRTPLEFELSSNYMPLAGSVSIYYGTYTDEKFHEDPDLEIDCLGGENGCAFDKRGEELVLLVNRPDPSQSEYQIGISLQYPYPVADSERFANLLGWAVAVQPAE